MLSYNDADDDAIFHRTRWDYIIDPDIYTQLCRSKYNNNDTKMKDYHYYY